MAAKKVVLVARPDGNPKETDLRCQAAEVPAGPVPAGHVRVRNLFLSLDPYMVGVMAGRASYLPPVNAGDVMLGEAVSVVEEVGPAVTTSGDAATGDAATSTTTTPPLAKGDTVVGGTNWQTHAVVPVAAVRRLPALPAHLPASLALGVLGMPGVTAHLGVNHVGKLRENAGVVLVSTATGAVGAVVGQLAKLRGAKRVIGTASTDAKCRYAVEELGYDACINYRRHAPEDESDAGLAAAVRQAMGAEHAATGVEFYFDNVGGTTLDAVLPLMAVEGTIAVCGIISEYTKSPEQRHGTRNLSAVLFRRLHIHGFVVADHLALWPAAIQEMAQLVADGKLKYKEDVVDGLDQAPAAFCRLFTGENFGKLIVKV